MKKTKKAMALLLALSMVLMSGIFAFADGNEPPQGESIPVTDTEGTTQTEIQQPEQAADPSDEQGTVDKNQEAQMPEDNKDGNVPEGETAKPDGTEDSKENGGEGENTPALLSTTENEIQGNTTELGSVTASVYLRYDNTVPTQILESSGQWQYGPAGDSNHPYFKVKVDLNKIEELCSKNGAIKKYVGDYNYYSAQESADVEANENDVKACWNEILTAMSPEDQQKFAECFGAGPNGGSNFIGYVFKSEADGWHIDGILSVVPGYVTEFYLNGTIEKTDVDTTAMTTVEAKRNIESMLGVDSEDISWDEDGMGGTFERDYAVYLFTIRHGNNNEGYYLPPSETNHNVVYSTKIENAYYLARIYVDTQKIVQKPVPVEPKAAVYKINYYKQQDDGSYNLVESQFPIYAEIGKTVTADQKVFEGYAFNEEISNPTGTVFEAKAGTDGKPSYLVLNMYYDMETPQPSDDPIVPDPVIPVTPPVIPDPVDPLPQPQPLPPDDPLIEEPDQPTVNPQPLPPDDPLIEDEETKQPLPDDEHLIDPTNAGKAGDPDQPKTGDEAPLMALTGLFLVSAGALGAIYIKRKKED